MEIIEAIVLGLIQGIAEWIPVSSEGMLTLTMMHLFGKTFAQAIVYALWLHIGTLFAAIVYYKKDVLLISKEVLHLKAKKSTLTTFLFIATIASLLIGGTIYFTGLKNFNLAARPATILIAILLIVTGILQFVKKPNLQKKLTKKDAIFAGILQGFAVLPGISRSGITTATLLFRKFSGEQALRISFLMSIPLIFVSSIAIIVFEQVAFEWTVLIALLVAFVVGLFTIDLLMKIAKKINFAYFCFGFAALLLISLLV